MNWPRTVFALLLSTLVMLGTSPLRAAEFTLHSGFIPEYTISVGPTLENSTGLMIELLTAATRSSDIQIRTTPAVPWARAQAHAQDDPHGMLAHLSRTPTREANWQWVTIMYTDKVYAYTLQDKPVYQSLEEIRATRPRTGAKLGSASHSLLLSAGLDVETTPDLDRNFLKLFTQRLDVLLLQGMEAPSALQDLLNSRFGDEVRPLLPRLRRSAIMETPLWVVVSRQVPEEDLRQLKKTLDNFKTSPEYRAIIRKYERKLLRAERGLGF